MLLLLLKPARGPRTAARDLQSENHDLIAAQSPRPAAQMAQEPQPERIAVHRSRIVAHRSRTAMRSPGSGARQPGPLALLWVFVQRQMCGSDSKLLQLGDCVSVVFVFLPPPRQIVFPEH